MIWFVTMKGRNLFIFFCDIDSLLVLNGPSKSDICGDVTYLRSNVQISDFS